VVSSATIGPLIKFPKDDVERENFEGLPDSLAFFFFLRKIKASTAAPMWMTAPPAAPPAIAAIGGPLLESLAWSEDEPSAPLVESGV
jgi:hypothetical protein